MPADTHIQRVLDLASQKGLLRANDLQDIQAPRIVLTRLTASGLLERVGRGLYRLSSQPGSELEGVAAVATKVPQAVFCLLTALQFHELTTQLPRHVWISMPRGSHVPRIGFPPIKMVQMTGAAYSDGIETFERDGVKLECIAPPKRWPIASSTGTRLVWTWRSRHLRTCAPSARHRRMTCGATPSSVAWPM